MKKVIIGLLIFVVILFGGGYFLLFTQGGNNLLLPTINSYLAKKVDGTKLEVTSFTLKPSHLKANATINKIIDIDSDGDFDIFKKSIDMIYTINAKKIDTPEFKLDEKVYIKGKIVGDMKKSLIFGIGKISSAPLKYKLNLINNTPQDIDAKIQDADLSKLLIIAGVKPYAKGRVNLVVNMPNLETGDAKVSIKNGIINSKLLKKDFKIDLPKNSSFKTDIDVFIKDFVAKFNSTTITSLGDIKTSKGSYHVKDKKLSLNYVVDIKDLKSLKSITKQDFRGRFKANGIVKQSEKNLFVSLNTKSFQGKSEVYFSGDKLIANLTNVSSKSLLYKLNQPSYIDSRINSKINIKSIKNLAGTYNINLTGLLNKSIIKKLHKIDLPIGNKINLDSTGSFKDNKVFSSSNILTSLGKIRLSKHVFDIKKSTLKSLIGDTTILGGKTKIELHNNKLSLLLKDVNSKKLLSLANQPIYFIGLINSSVDIDNINKLNGKFNLNTSGMVSKKFVDTNEKLNIKTSGALKNSVVSLSQCSVVSKLFNLDVKKFSYNMKKNSLFATYHAKSDDLSTLNKLTNQKLKGSLSIDGNINMKKDLVVVGHSDKFGGSIDFILKNSDITAKVKNASILKITDTLSYPAYLDGSANADFKYNLKNSKGVANIFMDKAKLLPNKLTSIITRLKGTDLTKEHFNKSVLQARLSKNLIDFDFDAKSKSVTLNIKNGKIRQPGGRLDALLDTNINGDKYRAKIYGTTSNPKLKLDSSALREKAREKAKQKVRQKIENEVKKRLHIDKIDKEKVLKGLFKKLF